MFIKNSFMISLFKFIHYLKWSWIQSFELSNVFNVSLAWAFNHNFKFLSWRQRLRLVLVYLFFKSFLCVFALKLHYFIKHLQISRISCVRRIKVSRWKFLLCRILLSRYICFYISLISILYAILSIIDRSIKILCLLMLCYWLGSCIRKFFLKRHLISSHCWELTSKLLWCIVFIRLYRFWRSFIRINTWIFKSLFADRHFQINFCVFEALARRLSNMNLVNFRKNHVHVLLSNLQDFAFALLNILDFLLNDLFLL